MPLLNTLTRCLGRIASQAPTPLPALSGVQLYEVGAGTKGIRRAGHWLDGNAARRRSVASTRPRYRPSGSGRHHRPTAATNGRGLDRAVGRRHDRHCPVPGRRRPCPTCVDPIRRGAVKSYGVPVTGTMTGPGGLAGSRQVVAGTVKVEPVDGCHAKCEIRMEPDPEWCWFRCRR